MGQLPTCRIEPTIRPFINTGLDYFGPLQVRVKRSHEKRYGVIFTCMSTRAIHLEIAQDLSTDSFIPTFRKFGCRRGFPHQIFCDNVLNFNGAEREISNALKEWNQEEITQFCTMRNVQWNFNTPLAPHMRGTWERLIQSVKKSLREVLKEKYPKEYVLETLLVEIENILNSRPLTHVPINPNDEEPLTPNHFLIGPSYLAAPFLKTNDTDLNLINKWQAAQKLADNFWKRWIREYVTLLNRNKWETWLHRETKVGDIVLIYDSDIPKNNWIKGKIVTTFPDKKENVRIVDIKTSSGVYRRPVSKLCILDVYQESK